MNGAAAVVVVDREAIEAAGDERRLSSVFTVARVAEEPRVLIVDDDEVARAKAADALRAVGLVVDEVSNGLDALKVFEERRPHIALLEVMTPFVDGFSTCRAMRDLPGGQDVSIIMMTDLDDIESLQFGYDAGATDFITKPINPILLQHRMKYMLRGAEVVDQLRKSERKIAHLAYHDALTGLPNRRSLERYMAGLVQRRSDGRRTGAVFLIDLDGFKRVNDTFGHNAGDELICEVGRRITTCFSIRAGVDPSMDLSRPMLARLGGDEFVFVDPSVSGPDDASAVGALLLTAIGKVFDLRGHEIVITASIGMTLVSDDGSDVESLIQRADAAMYDAKAHDRNNARFYSPTLSDKARAQLEIEAALRNAVDQGELEVYYQPKILVATGCVTGAEALLRWRHPTRGLVSPDDFIPIAEETGLIVPIGRHVLAMACRQARAWHASPRMQGLRVAVNVSARQFRDPRFLDDLEGVLAETGLDPRALELEITEGTLMSDTNLARSVLRQLKSWGVWLALDDFGTGYSSLGYLRRFPFDTLKVDRSFIRDVLTDEGSAAITGAVIAMAQKLHLNVVAEGVETVEQLEYLRGLACKEVQGFLFSKAVPAAEFTRWADDRLAAFELEAPREMPPEGRRSAIPPMRSHGR
jgi:diguanylate cyclase (GGDEF)-like protein